MPLEKKIKCIMDIEKIQKENIFSDFISFLEKLNENSKDILYSQQGKGNKVTETIMSLLETCFLCIEENVINENKNRYGNPKFRIWLAKIKKISFNSISKLISSKNKKEVVEETADYFYNSFGSSERLDYGTGHETNFLLFLFSIYQLGYIQDKYLSFLVMSVFRTYLKLVRKIQVVYLLEPAGSHGVWGLDDFQFLPYYFGSSQLISHTYIKPKDIHQDSYCSYFAEENMFFEAVMFVKKTKTGSLFLNAPMLCDIVSVKTWEKINNGFMKMYLVEVLGKYSVMQHFLFGILIPFTATGKTDEHKIVDNCLCCVSSLPSSIAETKSKIILRLGSLNLEKL